MEYANNKVFGGTVNEGAYILYYTQTYNSIDAKHPVMTDVNSQIESSAHNVLCVGYNSNTGAAIYMDPELACMYSVNAGYFYKIII